jgi:glucose/mannose-6-phosphate isomerase
VKTPSPAASVTTPRDAMLETVEASPEQWARALAIARAADAPLERPRSVVVAGMGGSGVAGDVAALVASEEADLPVLAVHGEVLPSFVGAPDLVVLVSHSGGTEETLACAQQARDAGAALVAVTSGGALGHLVADAGGRVVEVPCDLPPRASMALLTVPVLGVLERVGGVAGVLDACARIPAMLDPLVERWSAPTQGEEPEPVRLARGLGSRQPVFLGVDRISSVVATRARNQVAENAERPAVAAELPEADHNQLVGWAGAGTGGSCDLVLLRPAREHERTRRRVAATVDLVRGGFAAVHEHRLAPDGVIGQVASGFLFVDLLSVHLALLHGVDPGPIRAIEELKRRL